MATEDDPFSSLIAFIGSIFAPFASPDMPSPIDGGRVGFDLMDGNRAYIARDRNPDEAPIATGPMVSAIRRNTGPIVKPNIPPEPANSVPKPTVSGKAGAKPGTWTQTNQTWLGMDQYERTAAMAMMEIDHKDDTSAARNVSAAIVNRARQRGFDLGAHVSSKTYQPTFEAAQGRQLESLIKTPQYQEVLGWVKRYDAGQEDDPTHGSTHYIAHASSMYGLYKKNPSKYPLANWGSWSGFDKNLMDYKGKLAEDRSHAFLAPDPVGRFSVARVAGKSITDRLSAEPAVVAAQDPNKPVPVRSMKIDPQTGNVVE